MRSFFILLSSVSLLCCASEKSIGFDNKACDHSLVSKFSDMNLGVPRVRVVACDMDILANNKSSERIVSNLKDNCALLRSLGFWGTCKLFTKRETIRLWGEEIGKITVGKGWVTKALAQKIEKECNTKLSPEAIINMIRLGTEPEADKKAIEDIKKLSKKAQCIGFANQDRIEHEFFCQKMAQQACHIKSLFAGVVTLASYQDQKCSKYGANGYYRYNKKRNWYIVDPVGKLPKCGVSSYFKSSIVAAASCFVPSGTDLKLIEYVRTKAQLHACLKK